MSKTIREITEKDKTAFNKVATHPIQSWEWGEFREKTGNKVIRLGVFDKGKLIESAQLTIHPIPHTPYKIGVFLKGGLLSQEMLEALKNLGKEENLIFIKMEPNLVTTDKNANNTIKLLQNSGAKKGKTLFTKETFWIDLTKSEEELLKNMHPKTRYNIRVAQRHGVTVVEDNSKEAFEKYLDLTEQTTKRQGFYAHTEKYHRLMWETLKNQKSKVKSQNELRARLLTAKYGGEILIAWILFSFKDLLYYPYGASSDQHRNLMASYLMMWETIRYGKKLKLKTFDLWGKEEGKGFTRFKEGFAPKTIEFIGTWDLVINPNLYLVYRIAEQLRWKALKLAAHLPLPKPNFR
ncbi:MAG: peptidoglycan bridge formation glycyltransferase FemA/FemB family protein [Candidatus Blackburnbacteria bacterium]|nr:peptidoglycan bridge formation glycyltransferase FemA/FemB family protein [Candidatus Blackburnbacteria bacterium]